MTTTNRMMAFFLTVLLTVLASLSLGLSQVRAQVPAMPSAPAVPSSVPSGAAADLKAQATEKLMVNINSASAEDLAKLPGIGAEKAKAIIAARPFNSINDLKKVKGIKEGVFAKLKSMITVN